MRSWDPIIVYLATQKLETIFDVAKADLPHPLDSGGERSVGWPVGQHADYRFAATREHPGVHVQDFGHVWRAQRDRSSADIVVGATNDAKPGVLLGGAALGAAIAAIASKNPNAALAGALLGALAALAFMQDNTTVLLKNAAEKRR